MALSPLRSPSLSITSFSPGSGAVGDPIKIAGTGFSSTTADNELSFDGGATYVVANDFIDDTRTGVDPTIDTVVVNVPSDAVTGTIWVKVNDGTPVESANEFTVLSADELAITSISPTRGAVGEEVTITGQNFGDMIADNTVTFLGTNDDGSDDRIATISDASTTRLVVNVPDDAVSGPIEVEVDGETATSTETFTVTTETPFSVPKSSDVIRVYPNPTSGEVQISNLPTGRYTYCVYSVVGRKVLSGYLSESRSINLTVLSSGQYILVLSSEESNEVIRTRLLIVK